MSFFLCVPPYLNKIRRASTPQVEKAAVKRSGGGGGDEAAKAKKAKEVEGDDGNGYTPAKA